MTVDPPPLYDDVLPILKQCRDDVPWVSSVGELQTTREIRRHAVDALKDTIRGDCVFLKMSELLEREYVIDSGTVTPRSSVQLQWPFATNDSHVNSSIKHRTGQRTRSASRVAVISDTTLYGSDAVAVTSDGKYLLPDGDGTVTHLACLAGAAVRDYASGGRDVKQYDAVVAFTGFNPTNYYHWWIEHAPKLLAVAYYEEKHGVTPTILVPSDVPSWAETMFREFGYWKYVETWTGGIAQVDEFVLMRGGCLKYGYHEPSVIDWLHTIMTDRFANETTVNRSCRSGEAGGKAGEHIFISRGDEGRRTVANRDAVVGALPDTFDVYELASLTVQEQVRLFRDAEIIVAPHGAGLTNMIWATDATVIEILGETIHGLYYDLAAVCGHSYAYATFPKDESKDIVADPSVVAGLVEGAIRNDRCIYSSSSFDNGAVAGDVERKASGSSQVVGSGTVTAPPFMLDFLDVISDGLYGDALLFTGDEQFQITVPDTDFRSGAVSGIVELMKSEREIVVSMGGELLGGESMNLALDDETQSITFGEPVTGSNPLPDAFSEIVGCEKALPSTPTRILRNVSLHGPQAAVATTDGKYVLDDAACDVTALAEKAGRAVVDCHVHPESFTTDASQTYGAALSLVDVRGDCPERWFTYQLPKLRAFDTYVAETEVTPTILVPEALPDWAWRSLELLGYADHAEVWDGGVASVDEFILTHGGHPVINGCVVQPQPLEWLHEKFKSVTPGIVEQSEKHLDGVVGDGDQFNSRVYLYHGGEDGVRVKNVERVLDSVPGEFEAYDLAALSLDEIIAVFRNADVVVGAHSPWLIGVLWCGSLDVFVEVLPPNPSVIPYQLTRINDVRYVGAVYPVNEVGDSMHVRVDEIAALVENHTVNVDNHNRTGSESWVLKRIQRLMKHVTTAIR